VTWRDHVRGDPLPWLLAEDVPAVRAATLERLLDRPAGDPDVVRARAVAMSVDPIRAILDAQLPGGAWAKGGPGYAPKYSGTVWQLTFLDQLAADPADARVQEASRYVLGASLAVTGGFGASGAATAAPPPPSAVIHCLNGNLLRALIGFGFLDDPRVQAAIGWAANAITGEEGVVYHRSGTSGPGFACAGNGQLPCGWGAIKELRALARIPPGRRGPLAVRAIDEGVRFLLSIDPADADYPRPSASGAPSGSWFKLGFPSGYVADVLQNLEVLAELGHAGDSRLERAVSWLEAQQDAAGRWANRYAYNGKTTVDFERQGDPSKWVTLRACAVLRAVHG
jgi:hypothetical protein